MIGGAAGWAAYRVGRHTGSSEPGRHEGSLIVEGSRPLAVVADGATGMAQDTFALRNGSSARVAFVLRPSCGCTDVTPRANTLEPGESCRVQFTVRVQQRGHGRTVQVGVEDNSGRGGDRRDLIPPVLILAEWPAPLRAVPAEVDFGDALLRQTAERRVRLIIDEQATALQRQFSLQCQSPEISITLAGAKNDELVVQLDTTQRPGHVATTIRVVDSSGTELASIPVRGRIVDAITVAPPLLHVRKKSQSQCELTGSSFLVRRNDGGALGRLDSIEVGGQGVSVHRCSSPNPALFIGTLQACAVPESTELIMRFSGYELPIRVPLLMQEDSNAMK